MGKYEVAMLVSAIILVLSSIALVVIVLIQSNSAKGLSGTIAGGGSETYFGKNKKNSIAKKLLIITIVVTIVFALVSLGVSSFQKTDESFAKIYGYDFPDENGVKDGKISAEELETYKTAQQYVDKGFDVDHDGYVTNNVTVHMLYGVLERSEYDLLVQFKDSEDLDEWLSTFHEGHENCKFHTHDHE